jgi:Phage integrase family
LQDELCASLDELLQVEGFGYQIIGPQNVCNCAMTAVIQRRIEARKRFPHCPLIFHRRGKPIGDFHKVWGKACAAAGLVGGVKGYIPYDCRRTAVRNLIRAGVEESTAMKISGHRTRSMLDRYNITSDEDIQEAMVKVTEYVSTLPVDSQVVRLNEAKAGTSREHGQ